MSGQESPNPRPRRTHRTRDEDDATSHPPEPPVEAQEPSTGHQGEGAAQQQQSQPQAQAPDVLTQMMQFIMHSQQQQQVQMREMMVQQLAFQQQLLSQQTQLRLPQKKKGDPPIFKGNASEDLELWIFSTEQYYAQHREEMRRNSSEFVDTIFANLGTVAQTWFRDRDFQQKVLTKLHDLHWQGSQQEYTTKFLHLLSQLDEELPESVKRWMYQRNLRAETSSFILQNVPDSLQATIELTQRFEDSQPAQSARNNDTKKETKPQQHPANKELEHRREAGLNRPAATARKLATHPTCAVPGSAIVKMPRPASPIRQKNGAAR